MDTLKIDIKLLEELLQEQVAYRLECNSIGSKHNYTSSDFNYEGLLFRLIRCSRDLNKNIF